MTNFEKIKQMSVEDMAEMLLDASEKTFYILQPLFISKFLCTALYI